MTTPPNEPRIAPLPRSEWDADTVELIGKMISTDGEPLNIFATIAQHPKLLKRWLVFAAHVLSKNELPPRHRETADPAHWLEKRCPLRMGATRDHCPRTGNDKR